MTIMISHYKQVVMWFYILIFLWPIATAKTDFGRSLSSCQYGRSVRGQQLANHLSSQYIVSLGRVSGYKTCIRSCCQQRDCNMVWMVSSMCYLVSCPISPLSDCLIKSDDQDSYVIPVRNVPYTHSPNSTASSRNYPSGTKGMATVTTHFMNKVITSQSKDSPNSPRTNDTISKISTSNPMEPDDNDQNENDGIHRTDDNSQVDHSKDSQRRSCGYVNGKGCEQNEKCVIDRFRGDAFCKCQDGFMRDEVSGKCKYQNERPDNNKFCQSDDDCPPNANCIIAHMTHESKCICRHGYIFNSDNTRCLLKVDKDNDPTTLYLKRRCTNDNQCPRHATCRLSKSRCICQEGSQPDRSHILCILKSRPNEGSHNVTSSGAPVRPTTSEPKIHKTRAPITILSTSSFGTTKVTASKDATITNEASTPTEKHLNKPLPTTESSTTPKPISTTETKTVTTVKTKSPVSATVKPTKANVGTDRSVSKTTSSQVPTTTHIKELQVNVGFNRNITLPLNSITIYGTAWPPSTKNHPYNFEWNKVFSPVSSKAVIAGQHTALLSLSNIDVPGVYGLKLTVRGENSYGQGYVNVTVFPAVRDNKPPVAVIYPKYKEITLPIQKFVLDGSRSSDDNKIVKYEWELVAGPLNYYLKKKTEAVLQLTSLEPGTYKFKLTVTDSDGVQNSTLAEVKVNKAMDYKPVAQPGPDVLLNLPQNSVILNGSGSYDDNGIARYVWTKLPGSPKIADMQGTTSAVLHVTNLVVGHYVFQLNVTDTSGQVSSATVTVVVRPEDNKPPTAVAGPDKDLVSPDDSTVLDGSSSSDDRGIVSYLWHKVSGPNSLVMRGEKTDRLKLTKLKLGTYVFELIVTDDRGLQGKDTVNVFVKKDDNKAPTAKIVGDIIVQLPKNDAVLNGSLSSDDYGIVSYEWSRSDDSPAVGTVLEGSDKKPILRLAGLVPGKYTFTLKVVDQKGLYDEEKATITVLKSDSMKDLVEVKIDTGSHTFTYIALENLFTKISLALGISRDKIKIDNIHEINSGGVSIVFHIVNEAGTVQKGTEIVSKLKLKSDKESQLNYWIVSVNTYLCHNECSGHGYCDNLSKKCVCNSFWMENFFKAGLQGQSNCEWSILYVIIICASLAIGVISIIWLTLYCCRKRRNRNKRKQKFTMLEDKNARIEMKSRSKNRLRKSALFASDSDDSDENTLFDANNAVNRAKSIGNGIHNRKLNGGLKNNKTEKV